MTFIRRAHGKAQAHFEKHYRARFQARAHLVFIIDSVLVLAVLILLGLGLYFSRFYHPLRDDFRISVLTEEGLAAGRETAVTVRIVNDGENELRDAVLTVRLPAQFRTSGLPQAYDAQTGSVEIGILPPQASAEYRFRGIVLGPPASTGVYAHFTAHKGDGAFDEKIVAGTLTWGASLVAAAFELPETVVAGQTLSFKLRVRNGSSLDFGDVVVHPKLPEGFRLRTSSPPLYHGKLALGELKAGEEADVVFTGTYDGRSGNFAPSATVSWVEEAVESPLISAAGTARLHDAGLDLAVVEVTDGVPVQEWWEEGSQRAFEIRYANRGTETLRDVRFELPSDPRIVGYASWEAPPLEDVQPPRTIAPGESGSVRVSVKLLPKVSHYAVQPTLRLVPEARFSIPEQGVKDAVIQGGGTSTYNIWGRPRLRVEARYYTAEGEQLGRGPLPPRVGAATRYWIVAAAEASAADLTDGLVFFPLAKNVRWTGKSAVAAGDPLAFDERARVLLWRVGDLPAHAGTSSPAPSVAFEVELTPTEDQIGKEATLISGAIFHASTAWLWQEGQISSRTPVWITTRLKDDERAAGRFLVSSR